MNKAVMYGLFVLAVVAALALRVAWPGVRPMHHDEANQAIRFGELLESGHYQYDQSDHHGPTLYYLTLPVAWLRGQHTTASLDECTIRLLPALFGVGLILLFPLLASGLGKPAIVAAALLAAVSPALTYYSRFYIQEPLFIVFALGFLIALGRYAARPRVASALWAGACAGLAYATKETSVIVLVAGILACVIARFASREPTGGQVRPLHLALAAVIAAAIATVFYSSFFRNPTGVIDSIRAYGIYVQRGVNAGGHQEPWYYYLRVLGWTRSDGLLFSEGLILGLALVGVISALRARGFWPLYISLYSIIAGVLLSLLPYKTPWNALPFYVGFVLMAGAGVAAIARMRSGPLRIVALALVLAAAFQLADQAWRASFRYGADPRNPYAYAHTSSDFLGLVQRVSDVATMHRDGRGMLIKVVSGPYEQWPLPWYLRRMTRVGYWTSATAAQPLDDAPVIVASQDTTVAIESALGDRYVSEFYGLRPGVLMTLYIERGLWDRFLASRARRPADLPHAP